MKHINWWNALTKSDQVLYLWRCEFARKAVEGGREVDQALIERIYLDWKKCQ